MEAIRLPNLKINSCIRGPKKSYSISENLRLSIGNQEFHPLHENSPFQNHFSINNIFRTIALQSYPKTFSAYRNTITLISFHC